MKAKVQAELEREKLDHAKNVQELERRNVQEKERLKKEMLIKIKETKQNLLSMTEDQLHTTTKRTIMENEQMTTELQYQSKETEKLLVASKRLGAENKRLKRDIEIRKQRGEVTVDIHTARPGIVIGKSGAEADRDRLTISFGDMVLAELGWRAPDYDEAAASAYMKNAELRIGVDLGLGQGARTVWTCDLTHEYIRINAEYRS